MVVFHVVKFVQMAPNRAKHHILACKNVILQKKKKLFVTFFTQLSILIDYRFIIFLRTDLILSIYTKNEEPREFTY